MYGLDEASYIWYETLRDFFLDRGCKKPISDPAFFYYQKDRVLAGIIALWVDDVFTCGNEDFEEDIMKPLTEKFKFGAFHTGDFKVLGLNVIHRGPDIYLSQTDYIEANIQYVNVETPIGASPAT